MKKISSAKIKLFLMVLLLTSIVIPGLAQFGNIGKPAAGPEFLVYTFKADPTVKIGYPSGWTVQENQMGAVIVENQTSESAGILFFVGQLQPGVNSNADLAKTMVDALRQQGYPDLQVTSQQPHSQAPDVLTLNATLTSEGVPFQCLMWSAVNLQNKIGLFFVFYAPGSRYATFNADQYLTECVKPMFSGQ